MGYLVTSCSDPEVQYFISTDLSAYVGKVIYTDKPAGCYFVEETLEPAGGNMTPIYCYPTCEDCMKTSYKLTDCDGNYPDMYHDDPVLADYVGDIVKVPYLNDACFLVQTIQSSSQIAYTPFTGLSFSYKTCIECKTLEPVTPPINVGTCDPDRYLETKCTFVELMFQQSESRRLGIDFCCQIDKTKWTIKNEILEHDLLADPDPALPEPYVEECCLVITKPCPPISNCGCNNDQPIVVDTVATIPCNCTASENSPHDCHTYVVSATTEQLALAIGNDDTTLNGKILFGYYKCKATTPTTVIFETVRSETLCVLGIPVFGYYADNEWNDILTITRGALCEPPVENTCCND